MANKVQKTKIKLDKAEERRSKAQEKIPKKRQKSKLVHKEAPKSKLSFEESKQKPSEKLMDKPKPPSKLVSEVTSIPKKQMVYAFHKELAKYEEDNAGVESAHNIEKGAEFTGRRIKSAYASHKRKPYKNLAKAEKSAATARVNHEFEKKMAENPNLKSNPISRFQQKRALKKQYAQAYREGAKTTATGAKAVVKKGADAVTKAVGTVVKNPKILLIILIAALVIFIIIGVCSATTTMMQGGLNSFVGTSYTSEDEEILATEQDYVSLENELQRKIDRIESDYPGYDEYRYDLAEIGHNPHELASYLTSLLQYYKKDEVTTELRNLFELQYKLTLTPVTEVRYRSETRTDSEGNSYTVQVPYDYHILNVKLQNYSIDTIASRQLTAEQLEMYQVYRETKGNKPNLFPDSMQSGVPPVDYEIPGDALTDPQFAALIREAEKYLGYPYVWGGSSPSTSFDCSGFVCWVLNQSGTASIGRTTAQGIYNQCALISPTEAKPGDIIFFTGTYDSRSPVTHVGIYVGGGMMIHCGDPISYASINSKYWTDHFYAFGRIN